MSIDSYTIAFIGLGEAASSIISGWGNLRNNQMKAYDIKLHSVETKEEILARAKELNIRIKLSIQELVKDSDLIFSTVTSDQALKVAKEACQFIKGGAYFFDLNSCAPSSKKSACKSIGTNGGGYIDVAVMAPIYAKKTLFLS